MFKRKQQNAFVLLQYFAPDRESMSNKQLIYTSKIIPLSKVILKIHYDIKLTLNKHLNIFLGKASIKSKAD